MGFDREKLQEDVRLELKKDWTDAVRMSFEAGMAVLLPVSGTIAYLKSSQVITCEIYSLLWLLVPFFVGLFLFFLYYQAEKQKRALVAALENDLVYDALLRDARKERDDAREELTKLKLDLRMIQVSNTVVKRTESTEGK